MSAYGGDEPNNGSCVCCFCDVSQINNNKVEGRSGVRNYVAPCVFMCEVVALEVMVRWAAAPTMMTVIMVMVAAPMVMRTLVELVVATLVPPSIVHGVVVCGGVDEDGVVVVVVRVVTIHTPWAGWVVYCCGCIQLWLGL